MSTPGSASRRGFLALAGSSLAAAGLGGCASEATAGPGPQPTPGGSSVQRVPATGARQAGIQVPAPAQSHQLTVVHDLTGPPGPLLAALGTVILALTCGTDQRLAGLEPGDLTVTVGVGPRLVAGLDRTLPGAQALPAFPHEDLAPAGNGDVLIQLCATDPLLLPGAAVACNGAGGGVLRELWRQHSFRGPVIDVGGATAPRNLLGFVDGIVNPRSGADFDADVWLAGPSPVAGGTIAVIRRMEIDVARFLTHTTAQQEAVFGRRRDSAVPLSGGLAADPVDLGAKAPDGAFLIPADAHLRRAHPGATGVPTMLRRSYSFSDSTSTGQPSGLLFVSFQNALSTFVRTLNRMSEKDALLDFTTTTWSGTFLILPGFTAQRSLGASLFS